MRCSASPARIAGRRLHRCRWASFSRGLFIRETGIWKLVIPRECRCDWPATSPAMSSAADTRRHVRRDQAHGPVVQRARRAPGSVPLDPAVRRVGGASRRHRGDRQGRGVHPGAVVIPVRQEGGPPAGHRVQVIGRRQAPGEGGTWSSRRRAPRRPAAGIELVGGDGLLALGLDRRSGQVAAQALQAAADRMHMRVAEGRQRQPAAQVDDPGAAAGPLPHLLVAADGGDHAVADREGLDEAGRVSRRADLPPEARGRPRCCSPP